MKLKSFTKAFAAPLSFATLMALSTGTQAALMDVTVTIENLAPTNSVSFAPLRLGFHNGTFDAFDAGSAASDAIISIAEGGSGTKWFADFEAAEPNAVLGSVVNGGPSIPSANAGVGNGFSATASNTFRVDTSDNAFFSFANMVVPSNDLFLGNDNPLRLFDNLGSLLFSEIRLTASDIWDANSEVADASAGAFILWRCEWQQNSRKWISCV
ncbi:spondin domain-containing protein [Paraglaciecola aquimarina]|uniref:Spondin domain-containing protein n=1 Tax=Paraglaciecola aquimarina TaxID=1235557 RepID=A0ABU3SVN0_9ALTE|nr:spondin domain-containing protein [Paraglaciecola aquimarina]MDU0354048.1 spondin domain-containing protein [Paraglaciecola aquimarina]